MARARLSLIYQCIKSQICGATVFIRRVNIPPYRYVPKSSECRVGLLNLSVL